MKSYNPKNIESKWQKAWEEQGLYKTREEKDKPKYYILDMFPYPSGEGLHVGHPKGYIATDIHARFKRMNGYNVLHPMGWDAFGLPAENYALKNKVHPSVAVEKNITRFKEQLGKIGFSYDWEREINTTDPKYYKWTQWIFLQLFKKGLAYESNEPINWCPSCKTGLALEDLEGGHCERCGSLVEKKPIRQWVLKIREYADRLLYDLDDLAWPESVKELQRNWIGRSEGSEITFEIKGSDEKTKVFTTRPDTLFGATYMVLAPDYPLVENQKLGIKNQEEVVAYIDLVKAKSDIERMAEGGEKTGVKLEGVVAINPATKKEIPVFIADYVLLQYGTGAIMAVPAHDERDHAFAEKFKLPIIEVLNEEGVLINSGEFNGMESDEAKPLITKFVGGEMRVNYRLRDWVFSRQRYWGEPIPIIHCEKCGAVAVPDEELPVLLPQVDSYEPTGTGESPLANIESWVNVACPQCEGPGKRETNTMPQWAGSSWYYLRFIDPNNDEALVDKNKEKYWSPVDMYVGGVEHATRHLIYARFWHKFLYDIGVVNNEEPFTHLKNQGLIAGEDGRKMSKRWGNVINPDDVVETYGADTLRLYEMFMGPFEEGGIWSDESIVGPRRFLEKVWKLKENISDKVTPSEDVERALHQTIKKVTEDIEGFNFNTAVSAMMILVSAMEKADGMSKDDFEKFLLVLAPFAPYMTEELWKELGHESSIHLEAWPSYDEAKTKESVITIAVQVNGKVRGDFQAPPETPEEEMKERALAVDSVQKWLDGKEPKKLIYIKGRLISIVV